MKAFTSLITLGVTLALPLSAAAQEPLAPLSRSPLQPQIEFTTSLTEELSLRLGVSQFEPVTSPAYSVDGSSVSPSGLSAAALVDWNFAPGGFRLTGGALYGDYGLTGSDAERAWGQRGEVAFVPDPYGLGDGRLTPYVGLGWGMEFADEGRFGLQLDMGVLLDGAAVDGDGDSSDYTLFDDRDVFGEDFDGLHYTPTFSADFYFRF
jgi:hypothetical protein